MAQQCHPGDQCITSDATINNANLMVVDGNLTIKADYTLVDSYMLIRQVPGNGPAYLRVEADGFLEAIRTTIATEGDVRVVINGTSALNTGAFGPISELIVNDGLTSNNWAWQQADAIVNAPWEGVSMSGTIDAVVVDEINWTGDLSGNLSIGGSAIIAGSWDGKLACTGELDLAADWTSKGGAWNGCDVHASGAHQGNQVNAVASVVQASEWSAGAVSCTSGTLVMSKSFIFDLASNDCFVDMSESVVTDLAGSGTFEASASGVGTADLQGIVAFDQSEFNALTLTNAGGHMENTDVNGQLTLTDSDLTGMTVTFVSIVPSNSFFTADAAIQPVVTFANGALVEGATLRLFNGTTLQHAATTNADGTIDGHIIRVLRVTPGSIWGLENWGAEASLGTISTTQTLNFQNPKPTLVLTDTQPPAAVADLTMADGTLSWTGGEDDSGTTSFQLDLTVARPAATSTGSFQTTDSSYDLDLSVEGTFTIRVTPLDASGNEGENRTISFINDLTPPRITATPPTGGWIGVPIAWDPLGVDHESFVAGVSAWADGRPLAIEDGKVVLNESGFHSVIVTIYDVAGNQDSTQWAVNMDLTPPTVTRFAAESISVSGVQDLSLGISQIGTDAHSGVASYSLERLVEGTWVQYNRWIALPDFIDFRPDEGENHLRWRTIDGAGISSVGPELSIFRDSLAPALVGGIPASLPAGTWTLNFEDASDLQSATIWVDGNLVHSGSEKTVSVTLEEGTRTIHIKAVDNVGNQFDQEFEVQVKKGSKDSPGLIFPVIAAILGIFARNRNNGFNLKGV